MLETHLKFHHIGVATRGIDRELAVFRGLGYAPASAVFTDEIQKIKGLFIEAAHQPRLELLENLTPDGPLNSCLQKGVKFYHFAYATKNIEKDADFLVKEKAAKMIVPLTRADYFSRICFFMLPNMMMVELVEEKEDA